MSAATDGSESVDQFLARIANVKSTDENADHERSRREQEEFLKQRKERQERRAERARSLSPSKTGPAAVLSVNLSSRPTESVVNPPVDFSPQTKGLARSNAVRTSPTLETSTPEPEAVSSPTRDLSSNGNTLSRSDTLSWQQRSKSKDDPSRTRPLSGFATVRSLPKPATGENEDQEPSRKEIAASLGMKDPAWFRQTHDRGLGSAAYRKNQVEDTPTENFTSRGMQLPGMSQERSRSARSPVPEQGTASDEQVEKKEEAEIAPSNRFTRGDTPDMMALRNSMVQPSVQKSTVIEPSLSRPASMDSKQESTVSLDRSTSNLLHGGRSPSPTKGLGGFVESAMMKRSDSVSKRWNVQASSGLKRGDSSATTRPAVGLGGIHSRGLSRDRQNPRDDLPSSPLGSSRPGSSHESKAKSPTPEVRPLPQDSQTPEKKSSGASRVRSEFSPPVDTSGKLASSPDEDMSLHRSPSKTMDPRRWSPTKSSWLESALSAKPEPPKMQPLKEQQPSWMVDLQRSKSRASRDPSPSKASQPLPRATVNTPDFSRPTPVFTQSRPFSMHSPSPSLSSPTKKLSTPEPKGTDYEANDSSSRQLAKTGSLDDDLQENFRDQKSTQAPASAVSQSNELPSRSTSADDTPPKKPPALKPKPQTPPKTDFRSTLKNRAAESAQASGSEPEFRSVFGKLKPATTQNYVAPDVLKTNILSGKAALNVTGGPQKTKRVDEFKESILAKKEEMKAGTGSSHTRTESKEKPETPVPEALARRKTLSKASTSPVRKVDTGYSIETRERLEKPELKPKPKDSPVLGQPKIMPKPSVLDKSGAASAQTISRGANSTTSKPVTTSEMQKPALHGMVESNATEAKTEESAELSSPPLDQEPLKKDGVIPSTQRVYSAPKKETPLFAPEAVAPAKGELPPGSKLASRLNPNLAAILSRGGSPRPAATENAFSEDLTKVHSAPSQATTFPEKESSSGNLTHMTKARAKGPKRRAPKSESPAKVEEVKATSSTPSSIFTSKPLAVKSPPLQAAVSPTPQKKELTSTERDQSRSPPLIAPTKTDREKVKPAINTKSPELRKVSSNQTPSPIQALENKPKPSPAPKPITPKKFEIAADKSAVPTGMDAKFSKPQVAEKPMPLTPSKSKMNTPSKPQSQNESQETKKQSKPVTGLGLDLKPSTPAKKTSLQKRQPTPPPDEQPPTSSTSVVASSVPKGKIEEALKTYFSAPLKPADRAEFETAKLLKKEDSSTTERCKTTENSITEITGDGKKIPMPPQQEHILFEESMYLSVHTFEKGGNANKVSEVYLWCGDGVSEASIEDAQLFCRKNAREHNAKLEVIRQGKEHANFIQALGGILIVRRSKSSALYMLCGRRHLGHIVFDEVELALDNLCSGFPYLISAQFGNLYLWKGRGAGADEVGCARLIGMDLGLTGEMEEVDEGREPDSFWEAFSSKDKRVPSEDWAKRADLNGYPTALFKIEHEQAKSGGFWGLRPASPPKSSPKAAVTEVSPFCQRDLEGPQVSILDAYRHVYVLVNHEVSTKPAEFVTAIYLAQEIAMLAPSIQDRPLLPSCYVIFGEPPGDVRSCFRKWTFRSGRSQKPALSVALEDVLEELKQ